MSLKNLHLFVNFLKKGSNFYLLHCKRVMSVFEAVYIFK